MNATKVFQMGPGIQKKKSFITISQKQGGVGQMVLGKKHSPIAWKVTVVFSALLKFQVKES